MKSSFGSLCLVPALSRQLLPIGIPEHPQILARLLQLGYPLRLGSHCCGRVSRQSRDWR
ncbi:hypothetical protein [Nostoc sp. FACHB-145]|uniref:hypothetical protein n=1 Tax=Nostoc sp. FACHB-145 TaxID=2692836 RepID=UPI00168620A7|nr:hypothetical protein [Nostoc sp. FACHB-145]MBD2472290.1 hypothetical protein [Nostoc sp. FACHB-145]